jgi:hypothetical protein
MENPPDVLKNLPAGLVRQWIAVFNEAAAGGADDDAARAQAWGAVKKGWDRGEDGVWTRKRKPENMGELVDGVEILRTGTHTAMSGARVTITDQDLRHLADEYDPAYHEAPVVIGHPADNGPAYGWVKNLAASGGRLLATLDLVPQFVEALRQNLFKKRSASLYPDLDGRGLYLRHVGFLGALPPAIKALADIGLADGKESVTLQFEEETMSWKDKVKSLFGQAVDEIPEAGTTQVVVAQPARNDPPPAQFSEADVTAREKAAAEAAAKAERDKVELEFADKMRKLEIEAQTKTHQGQVQAKIDSLVKAGKVLPGWIKAGLAEFAAALPWQDEAAIEFADGEGKVKLTPSAWLLDKFLPGLPPLVNLGEFAGNDKDPGKGGAGEKLNLLTRKKMEAHPELGYSQAFIEAQRENPELAREYADSLK